MAKKPIEWIADKSGIKYPKMDLQNMAKDQVNQAQRTVQYVKSQMPKWEMGGFGSMSQSTPATMSGKARNINRARPASPWTKLDLRKRK